MEMSAESEGNAHKSSINKGGLKTMPLIIGTESVERVATSGLLSNLITYLIKEYNMPIARAASVLFIWTATTNFVPLVGAFLADSYWGRFRTIVFGSIATLLGATLLWTTAMIPGAIPEMGKSASSSHLALLFCSLILMAIGTGGVRPCSLAFGADQLAPRTHLKKSTVLQSFFNGYFACMGASTMLAVTVIVYIQEHMGWKVGLGLPAGLILLAVVFFLIGSPLYIKIKAKKSLFTGLAQAIVAAVKNRHLDLPPKDEDGCHYHSQGSNSVLPTNKLRCLNKACITINPHRDLNADGSASNPWNLSTVEQVEELKSLIRLLPMWSTGITIALTINQFSFSVVQANTMDRHIGPHFEIPGGSFGVFTLVTVTIWIAIYDRIIVPLVRRITGRQSGIALKQRMGIGLLLSIMAMAVSGIVESVRRRRAIEQGLSENWQAKVDMSAMWLIPQYCLTGLGEAFNLIGQIEFYYSELPQSMSSIAIALFSSGLGIGNLMGSVIIAVLDELSKKGGKESWVSNNLNKGHYDYYYWVLTTMSGINFLYFLLCCWAYGPSKEDVETVLKGGEEKKEEEEEERSQEIPLMA